ncbi:MAG: 30S ribosomal protein S1 [Deltaproteobacteria bacterium]
MESFRDIVDDAVQPPRTGDYVAGRVVAVDDDGVTVDIGCKSEGIVPIAEFVDAAGDLKVVEGDEIEVYVEALGADGAEVKLSYSYARESSIWREIESAYQSGGSIEGKIIGSVKGGLKVDVGVLAFLPGSHVDIRPHGSLERYVGDQASFAVLKFNRTRGNVVVSRKLLLEKEREAERGETLKLLEEGVILEGVVKNVTDYGAFVDLGGVDGLLHVTDMSWGRVGRPSEVVSSGDQIKVVVLKYDADGSRISLGLKQLSPDPWSTVADRLFPGSRVGGKVMSLTDYGAFVEVEDGIEGLVHVSEMSWTGRIAHPSKVVSVGQEVEVVVLALDSDNRRISLGLKQATANPWEQLPIDHPVGSRVTGKVTSLTDFGAFVSVAEGIDGLIHISDLHWTRKLRHPSELLEKGQEVEAVVMSIDVASERLSLGLKQTNGDPWSSMESSCRPGARVSGKITNVTDFGVFVEIGDGLEGMVHVSELSSERTDDPREKFKAGEEVEAVVLQVDPREKRISLSIKSLLSASDQKEAGQYSGEAVTASNTSLGDLINKELAKSADADASEDGEQD